MGDWTACERLARHLQESRPCLEFGRRRSPTLTDRSGWRSRNLKPPRGAAWEPFIGKSQFRYAGRCDRCAPSLGKSLLCLLGSANVVFDPNAAHSSCLTAHQHHFLLKKSSRTVLAQRKMCTRRDPPLRYIPGGKDREKRDG